MKLILLSGCLLKKMHNAECKLELNRSRNLILCVIVITLVKAHNRHIINTAVAVIYDIAIQYVHVLKFVFILVQIFITDGKLT